LVRELLIGVSGWDVVPYPFFELEAAPFSASHEQAIVNADALVFPSPFAIEATLARCYKLRVAAGKGMPLCAVIGLASLSTFNAHASALKQPPDGEAIRILAGTKPPYDAEHLAPILAEALSDLAAQPVQVVVLVGDKPGTSELQWQNWLSSDSAASVSVSLVQGYTRLSIDCEVSKSSLADKLAEPATVVYFTSVDAVMSMKVRSPDALGARALALTIHSNISRAVQEHLGWRVVEIEPGTPSLINWLKCQK
jgi:uroporphyrinogen-III synthase